jgi:hypothetical protein
VEIENPGKVKRTVWKSERGEEDRLTEIKKKSRRGEKNMQYRRGRRETEEIVYRRKWTNLE